MLKVYRVGSYYKVDGEEWTRCCDTGYMIREETTENGKIHLDKVPWSCVYEHPGLQGIHIGETFFRHRPYIEVSHSWSYDGRRFYQDGFKEFSYMDVYTERDTCSLEWIMKHASAEQTIQYMKERGMTACPLQ